jgi:anti-sigma-K factor RskA
MSSPHSHRFEEFLPAYALGALEGDELRELEAHLAGGCDECARQLALWQGDLEKLAAELPPVAPSEMTRARILRLAGEAAASPAMPAMAASAAVPPVRRAPSSPLTPWLAVAALLLLAFSLWGVIGRARMEREAERLAAERDDLARRVETLTREVGRAQAETERAKQALQILAAPGVQLVSLAGMGPSPGAAGSTYVNPRAHEALFYAFGLARLPDRKTYQLWFIAAGKPVSAGTFAVDPRGNASVRVDRVTDPRQIQAWAVTVEPLGGVPQPTGAMVLKGAASAA